MASLKAKGDLAELKVATDLLERGYRIAIPYGEDHDFDLIFCRDDKLERVQVKYSRSNGEFIPVKCYSDSLTNGRIPANKSGTRRQLSIGSPSMTSRLTSVSTFPPSTSVTGRARFTFV